MVPQGQGWTSLCVLGSVAFDETVASTARAVVERIGGLDPPVDHFELYSTGHAHSSPNPDSREKHASAARELFGEQDWIHVDIRGGLRRCFKHPRRQQADT